MDFPSRIELRQDQQIDDRGTDVQNPGTELKRDINDTDQFDADNLHHEHQQLHQQPQLPQEQTQEQHQQPQEQLQHQQSQEQLQHQPPQQQSQEQPQLQQSEQNNINSEALPTEQGTSNNLDKALLLEAIKDFDSSIPDAVVHHFLNHAGMQTSDQRIVRLVAVAAQKFIHDIVSDALQHCKLRGAQGKKTKERKSVLAIEDLAAALEEYGIEVKRQQYFN